MKTILICTMLLLLCATAYAQDATPVAQAYHADSLKTTRDTVDVSFSTTRGISYYTITAYTDSGTDTVSVYTRSLNDSFWTQKGLVLTTDNTDVTQMIVTTTAKEWVVLDAQPTKVRVTSPGTNTLITRFVVGGKGVR